MKIRKNKQKYKQVLLQEIMAQIPKNNMPKSNATISIEDYIYVLGIIRRYGLNYIFDKVKDKFELSNFVLSLFEYGISFNDYLVTSSILSMYPNIRYDNNNLKNMYSGKLNENQINRIQEIVNKISYISTWLNNLKLNQNTDTNKPKTIPDSQNNINLSKPIPNKNTESYGQKTDTFNNQVNYNKSDYVKLIMSNWITGIYKPAYLLSIRLPEHQATNNEFKSNTHLRMIMKVFEKKLLGRHWNKHHLRFIAFAENGTNTNWHYHVLFNQSNFTEDELQETILQTSITLKLPSYCLLLESITHNAENVNFYCEKEIKVLENGNFNSDSIILSDCLFYIFKNA